MADKRVIVEDLENAPRLKAREMETSDFRRPSTPINPVQGQSSLGQLVASLGDFNASLRTFNNIYMNKSNDEAQNAGLVEFYNNPDKYREAAKGKVADMVKNKVLNPWENPYKATTVLELTGQDKAEGMYSAKLQENLSKFADLSPEQLDKAIGDLRSKFVQDELGDSFYTKLGFSKRAVLIDREFRGQVNNLRLNRQNAKAIESMSSLSNRVFDDLASGDLTNDQFVTDSTSRLRGLLKEAQLGTISDDPNRDFIKNFQGWIQANYKEHPEAVRRVTDLVFNLDPRGDGNALKSLKPAEYGAIQDYLDSNANKVERLAIQKIQTQMELANVQALKFGRTFIATRLMETKENELSETDKKDLLDEVQKQPWYNEESKGAILKVLFGPEGLVKEKTEIGTASAPTQEHFDKARFEKATNDPLLAPKALEDLRILKDSHLVSNAEFVQLEQKLEQASQNKNLTDKSESFNFNKNSLSDYITSSISVDPQNPEDVKRKANLVDEGVRMYREAVSARLLAERNNIPNEPFEKFEARMLNSPLYSEVRDDIQKRIATKVKAEEQRLAKQAQVQKDMEQNNPIGSPSFFDKLFKNNNVLIEKYHDTALAMSRAIAANPSLNRPEYRDQLKGYYAEIKKMGDEDLAKFAKTFTEGGYYMWETPMEAYDARRLRQQYFVPYPPEKMQEVKTSFLNRLTRVGTSWTNFVDSTTGEPRQTVRIHGVQVDPINELNGLAVPLFSSRDEYNDVFSRPELANKLATALGVDVNQFRINQALRLLERGL